ncbi:ABC transporter permease [Alkalihalobacterium alkalinitrilicum]|uniref:ABC transporter permease n=1 Tax=Alkalihalobacterium alkalinitrilicum TaxID=427920 RepID=UPI000995C66D|nr:ABC transporter permease [Alkalihalobacterium alkalinitrilicum]
MFNILKKMVNDVKNHKDLIRYLTISDFKTNTARTYFGFLWWILDPILYMLIFYLLVQVILQRGGPDYSVFLFVALIPLKWTIACLVDATNAITSKARIIQQVYVPKIVFIVVRLAVNTSKFLISSVVLFTFLWVYGIDFTINMFYFFIIIIVHTLFLLGSMIILAHMGVYFKDIKNMMQYVARTLFYISPVMFSITDVPERLAQYLYINPLTSLIVSYRNSLLYAIQPEWGSLLILFLVSIVLLLIGLGILFKYEKHYAKVM